MIHLPLLLALALPSLAPAPAQEPQSLRQLADVARDLPDQAAMNRLRILAAQARSTDVGASLSDRLFTARCLGLLARHAQASEADLRRLASMLADESPAVRWVGLRGLGSANFETTELIRDARKALLRAWKAAPEDRAMRREAERLRGELLARLRPASPGAATRRSDESAGAGPTTAAPLARRRANANESAAIATLRNLCSAQAQAQASAVIDVDRDGIGEYGYFQELCGAVEVRGDARGVEASTRRITPPVLSGAFSQVDAGIVTRSGYCFRIFLPGENRAPVPEADNGGWKGCAVAPDQAELLWCAYAWPLEPGRSGHRAFFVDQSGDILATDNAFTDYAGAELSPDGDAARIERGTLGLGAEAAVHGFGRDGNYWAVLR